MAATNSIRIGCAERRRPRTRWRTAADRRREWSPGSHAMAIVSTDIRRRSGGMPGSPPGAPRAPSRRRSTGRCRSTWRRGRGNVDGRSSSRLPTLDLTTHALSRAAYEGGVAASVRPIAAAICAAVVALGGEQQDGAGTPSAASPVRHRHPTTVPAADDRRLGRCAAVRIDHMALTRQPTAGGTWIRRPRLIARLAATPDVATPRPAPPHDQLGTR